MRHCINQMLLLITVFGSTAILADDFKPDPRAVQRYGPAYRYPQAGWIVLHIEGDPYERGIQHGRLLAPEIAAYVRCLAAYNGPKAPTEAWDDTREIVGAMFLRGFTREQLEEMKGIADGASAAGARFDGRALDVIDIAALNAANELDSLPAALDATATGLEDFVPPAPAKKPLPAKTVDKPRRARPERCCAFAAVGPATKDGQLVFGHITMFDIYPANFYNVWIDVKPTSGHAFVMQSSPGGMHSGMDYSINDAGILLSETTLEQTRLEVKGTPLASRIRQAEQYAETIEQAAEMLTKNSNGLSSTEWILADAHKNEIALLTLGTTASKLYRSSQKEWIDGAEGFYWSCNNNKDTVVRQELVPGMTGRPSALPVFAPARRDAQWLLMADQQKGKIDADYARTLLTTPELVWSFSVDAMYTTGDMAKEFKTWGSFGPPVGAVRMPSFSERQKFPEVRPLVSNPWAMLHATAPAPKDPANDEDPPSDLSKPESEELPGPAASKKEADPVTPPAWHGTLLPKTDADIWLATGFAHYERIVALEHLLTSQSKTAQPDPGDLDQVGVEMTYCRSEYELGARGGKEVPLAETHATARDVNWFRVASNKGVMLLGALRGVLGEEGFDKLMDDFGRANAGKEVTASQFQAYLEKATGRSLGEFFDPWLHGTGLPGVILGNTEVKRQNKRWHTNVTLSRDDSRMMLGVPVTVETETGEMTQTIRLEKTQGTIDIITDSQPTRVLVDKYGTSPLRNAPPFTVLSFDDELGSTLIVYGSLDEVVSNREAAASLQQALRKREHNITARIKKDVEVTDDDIKSNHLLLIGRPNSNTLAARFADRLPVHFGSQSFEVRGDVYAHPDSVAIMAIENPLNRRYSVVVLAGLSSLATLSIAPSFEDDDFTYAPVLVLPHGQEEQAFVVPLKELTRDLP